uniref:Glutathione S-transferase n=1 Tax=Spermophilus dauricus TaxID=99837 RepID=A0A8C9PSX8_SPEDA
LGGSPDHPWLSIQLPYLIDGPHRITQSNAILRYIARKHNLCGETEEEMIRVDILENQAMDTRVQLAVICYSPDFEKKKPEFLETLPEKMKLYSQFLGKRPWFAGDKVKGEESGAGVVLDPTCPSAGSPILPFLSHSQGLKKISTYMKSSQFLRSPLYLKVARWSNK